MISSCRFSSLALSQCSKQFVVYDTNLTAFFRRDDLRDFRRVIEQNPRVQQRPVLTKEIAQPSAKSSSNNVGRYVVTALPHAIRHAGQREFARRNPEEEKVKHVVFSF